MDKVPVLSSACFLQNIKKFDDEGGAVDKGISKGCSPLRIDIAEDGGNCGF